MLSSPEYAPAPAGSAVPPTPTLRRFWVRSLIDTCCPRDPDLDAFCSDHFPGSFRRFSAAMERVQRITLLMECEGVAAVECALSAAFPRQYFASPLPTLAAVSDSLPALRWDAGGEPRPISLRLWGIRGVLLVGGAVLLLLVTLAMVWVNRWLVLAAPVSVPESREAAQGGLVPSGMHCLAGTRIHQRTETGEAVVTVPAFCLDVNLVTVRQYKDCFASGSCSTSGLTNYDQAEDKAGQGELDALCTERLPEHDQHPMNCVSWFEANSYCQAQSKHLPTAAEWEVAAGAEQNQLYPWGSDAPSPATINACDSRCVSWAEARGKIWKLMRGSSIWLHPADGTRSDRMFDRDDGFAATSPVGSKAPSIPYGFYDLSGNLRQWTSDTPTDCKEPNCEMLYILKGGSWGDVRPEHVNINARARSSPFLRSEMHGFRCASQWPQPNVRFQMKTPEMHPATPIRKAKLDSSQMHNRRPA